MSRKSNIIGTRPLTQEVFQLNLFVGSMKKYPGALTVSRQAVRIFDAVKFPALILHNIFRGRSATRMTTTTEQEYFLLKLKLITALVAAALLCIQVAQAQQEPAIKLGPFEMQPRSLNPLREPFIGSHPTPVAFDVDKDGATDVVMANYPSSDGGYQEGFHYLKNVGTASNPVFDRHRYWSNPFEFVAFGVGATPAFSDLDKDGDTDMLVGTMDGTLHYYRYKSEATIPYMPEETGAWNASTKTGNPFHGTDLGNYASPAFTDMDGDGDDDVVIGTSYLPANKSIHYYINDGAGNFAPGTLQGINPVLEEVTPAFIDLDKDGDRDLLLGAADGKIYYYKRTGQTSFEEQTGASNPFNTVIAGAYSSPTAADFDNDGDTDVIIGAETTTFGRLLYFEHKGNGTFEEKTGFANPFGGLDAGGDSSPYFADVDLDGDHDLIVGNSGNTLRYYANVNGAYEEQVANNPFGSLVISDTFVPSFIDLDGDGDKDLVGSVTETETRIEYYKNENGVFTHQLFSTGPFKDILIDDGKSDFADIDADGDFDLFVTDVVRISWDDWYLVRYFKNTGTAQSPVFTEETGTANPLAQVYEDFQLFPRFTDIDHDGDLDAIIGEGGGIVETSDGNEFSYYENTGSPTAPVFTYRGDLVQQGDNPYEPAPAFVDHDHDGDLDIFMGGQSGYLAYYRNMNPAVVTTVNTTPHMANFASGPAVIDAQLTLADADNDSIVYATVSIGAFQAGNETLVFTAQSGITGTFNATTGVLTFRGKAPLQHYQALLRTVALKYTGELASGRTRPYEYVTLSRTVTVQVTDADGTVSPPVSRSIVITDGSAPVFNDHAVSVVTRGTVVIDLAQLISDADNDVNLGTLTILQQPATGTTILNGTSLTIDYKSNFTGTETLVLQVCDATGACDQATITVNVTNVAPVIQPEPANTPEGTTKALDLLQITSDADGNLDASSFVIVQPPVSGAGALIEMVSGTEVRLTLNYDGITFKGTDQLTIRACDYAGACTESVLSVEVDVATVVEVFNAVAPKGHEENRYMHIANLPETNKVSIFNRWGDAVFVMNNYDNNAPGHRFEGISDNGNSLASGTYFYKIEFTDQTQKRQTLTGYLTLKQ